MTSSHDNVCVSLGENCCWSLLGLKGLIRLGKHHNKLHSFQYILMWLNSGGRGGGGRLIIRCIFGLLGDGLAHN